MADYQYIDLRGLIIPDTAIVRAQVISEYKTAFGEDLDTDPRTPQGILITAETLARETVIRNNAQLANQINPNLAGGVYLYALGALTGIEPNSNVYSTVLCDLTGVAATVIPSGSLAQNETGDVFFSTQTVTLDVNGMASVTFQAEIPGPITAPINTLTQIIAGGVLGWETITNPDAASVGTIVQSDESFRVYRRNTLAIQGSSLAVAITSALYATPGVTSVFFQENISDETVVKENVTMKPHSLYACVTGGTDLAVATSILSRKPGGCNYNGSTTVPVTDPASGQVFNITFDRPALISVRARFTISAGSDVSDPVTSVKTAVLAYARGELPGEPGFKIGASVSPFELSGAVNVLTPGIFVKKVEVSYLTPVSYTTDELFIEVFQQAIISGSSIIVDIV